MNNRKEVNIMFKCKCEANLTEIGYCPWCERLYIPCEECMVATPEEELVDGICPNCQE